MQIIPPQAKKLYIIIDDDPISVFLSRNMIQNALAEPVIIDFTSAGKGLAFIKEVCVGETVPDLTLFLDLNMPQLDGMGFLKKFAELNEEVKRKVKIIILSSTINEQDI